MEKEIEERLIALERKVKISNRFLESAFVLIEELAKKLEDQTISKTAGEFKFQCKEK